MRTLRKRLWRVKPTARRGRERAAFSMAELLVSMALVGAILAATAVAMQGVFISYAENEKIADVTQAARVVLHRMMKEVRTAEGITTTPASISIIPPDNPENILEIRYELAEGTLYYSQRVSESTTTVPLLRSDGNVQILGFGVSRETAMDGEVQYTARLTATLTLRGGGNALTVTASACPRRNLVY